MDINALKRDIVFRTNLRGRSMEFHSTWGLFCPRGIDDGSRMLANSVELSESARCLDIGCGYGPIGLSLAKDCPRGEVHLVDKDFVAVQYAAANAQVNGIDNARVYLSNGFSAVEAGLSFDVIASNLPANVGKEMLSILLHDARDRLVEDGRLYVVTVAGLRKFIKRNFEEVFGNYVKCKQGKTYTVAMATRT